MRTFLAFEIPEQLRLALAGVRATLTGLEPRWRDARWVVPENLHVTLKFLGDLPEESLPGLREAVGDVLATLDPPQLEYAGLQAVPSKRRASMLWATLDDRDGRAALAERAVDDAVAAFGVPPSEREFSAHVTLVRARQPTRVGAGRLETCGEAVNALLGAGAGIVSVPSATLYKSTLTPGGAVYETLAVLPFRT